ncbi:YhcG family protein [Actinobacillus porcinus]|uniref:PDDEXK nuclease domain-containing protein n=1 Tax=Actinobacillus porcinus TaxID=51048 RepID=UPI0023F48514|nr:PDDEXK nuclease domain-containing protein [Actinobacillus porcinus]MDD7544117.1 PDDEXK nuclease domain-containing protein [Actinobacillus porcinus]MDY5847385.1 PDDEXK nuclease domain-containing protein [Actinobacillus porcinus]
MDLINSSYLLEIKQILANARQKAYTAVNSAMVEAYWKIGERIVLEEQNGADRAAYGKEIIKNLSLELTNEFGAGFGERNIRNFRQFYLMFQDLEIWKSVISKLTWTHIQRTLKISNDKARLYYLKEAAENNWSVRTLDRNISTLYYDRLLASQDQSIVKAEMLEKSVPLQASDLIKSPTVLEFLNLPTNLAYTEAELEKALIDNLQQFMLELGKGFAFVARQQCIRTETSDFFIDLVFYNYILKCFVIVELKTEKLTHQDIGQLDMYVRMYDDLQKRPDDNPTIGLLLCTETDSVVAKYSVLNDSSQLFVSKYMAYLPSEEELVREIENQKMIFEQQFEK